MTPKNDLKPFLTAQEISKLVQSLSLTLEADYENKVSEENPLLVVITLKGGTFFAADLIRSLRMPLQIDFVRVRSYGSGTVSSGQVEFLRDTDIDPNGREVLILDEIVDSGHTLAMLLEHFRAKGAKSVKVCTLLNKPSRRTQTVPVDFCGLEVEDKFLVGYGLDCDEKYRNLKDIYYI